MPYRALLDLIDANAEGLAKMRSKIRRGERVTLNDVAAQQLLVNRMHQLVERVPEGSDTPTGVMPKLELPDGSDDETNPGEQ